MRRINTILVFILLFAGVFPVFAQQSAPAAREKERILFTIHPFGGTAEYKDFGVVSTDSGKARFVTFQTHVMGFDDMEKIYSSPNDLLALKVERDVQGWFGSENIIESYDQNNYTVTIDKYKGKKKVNEQVLNSDGPIYNPVMVPLYPRSIASLYIGWNFLFRIPKAFHVTLASIDTIRVYGHTYQAYHFISSPDKVEVWMNKDEPCIPLKIRGKGAFAYTLLMKEYSKP
jgi:hypothetical protein